jgi:hypothetical protein
LTAALFGIALRNPLRCKRRCSNSPFCAEQDRRQSTQEQSACGVLREDASCCDSTKNRGVPLVGLEQGRNSLGNTANAVACGAKSGAIRADLPPELARVVNVWPTLHETVKAAMLELLGKATT